jgi:formiminotetrahydrofolate cyclodeaminase
MLEPFLQALASDAPAPGGGTAAAASGAMAAALGHMVSRLALSKARKAKPDAPPEAVWVAAAAEFAGLAAELARATDRDSEAFLAIRDAWRMPKATPDDQQRRAAAVERATVGAAEVPLGVAARCKQIEARIHALQPLAPAAMASDLTTALALAQAGFTGARDNVVINLGSLAADSRDRARLEGELAAISRA